MKKFGLLVIGLLFIAVTVFAGVNLPRTGQYASYFPGDDGEIQAGLFWPNPRFSTDGDGKTMDGLTGLTWASDANLIANKDPGFDQDLSAGDGAVSFQHALEYIAKLNAENYLGHNDWRLPNRKELMSLVDYARFDPALPLYHPFDAVQNSKYWSSTSYSAIPDRTWNMNFHDGLVWYAAKSGGLGYVWPVRKGLG
jgi:hypothetical protein